MSESNNNNMVHRLCHEGKEIVLIGTAHVSQESSDLVAATIEAEKPDTVCVELCASRYQSIRQKDQWQNMDIVKVIKEKKAFLLLSNLILAAFQKRIAAKLDIVPGAEMIRAIEAADASGAAVHLADREIRVTLSRAWKTMTFWEKNKLLYHLLMSFTEAEEISQEDVEKMKEQDVLEALMADVGKTLPMIKRILIDERDQYLAEKIRTAPGTKIVAVVGAGHVAGIKEYWNKTIDIAALEVLPPGQQACSRSGMGNSAGDCLNDGHRFFHRRRACGNQHDYGMDSDNRHSGRHRGCRRPCPSPDDPFFNSGSAVDNASSPDCRRLGFGAG